MCDLVSIIVPFYNAENVLRKCITSLLEQTYKNYEIILINDGSTDNSKEVCKYFVSNSKIYLFNQSNKGVSAARNLGIEKSNGKWIIFLDSDDFMEKFAVEKAVKYLEKYDCDTVCWNTKRFNKSKVEKSAPFTVSNMLFYTNDVYSNIVDNLYKGKSDKYFFGNSFRAVWGKILSAEIIKNNELRFSLGLPLGEDALFLLNYFKYSKKFYLTDTYFNYYRISESSAVGRYKPGLGEMQKLEFDLIKKNCELLHIDFYKYAINQLIEFDYQFLQNLLKNSDDKNYFIKLYKYIKDRKNYNLESRKMRYDKFNIKQIILQFAVKNRLYFIESIVVNIVIKRRLYKKGDIK